MPNGDRFTVAKENFEEVAHLAVIPLEVPYSEHDDTIKRLMPCLTNGVSDWVFLLMNIVRLAEHRIFLIR